MGYLNNSVVTVDAILTKRGRELLASGEGLNITKFALSDEEVDYTLFDIGLVNAEYVSSIFPFLLIRIL